MKMLTGRVVLIVALAAVVSFLPCAEGSDAWKSDFGRGAGDWMEMILQKGTT